MNVKYYNSESFKYDDSLKDIWITEDGKPAKGNEYIVESAGFVPLSVKFKQFEQNGYIAKFNVDDFDSSDYSKLYQDDVLITPDDDEFDIADKIALFKERKIEILKSKLAETNETEQSEATRSEVSQASQPKQANESRETDSVL
ncbi:MULTISPECIES: hypothetical protein [Jeotgalibaca]|uniref:hypothetical protein n=1 Tax=Jeotgalibaca TaxID=1470540 RepID=UPI0035A1B558